jgi:outer membrane protein TolC
LLKLYKANQELSVYQKKTYENEFKKYKLGSSSQLDIISAYQDFAESRVSAYQLEMNIYSSIIQLKYLIGKLPAEKTELERSNFTDILDISSL